MKLTTSDRHYYRPVRNVENWITSHIPAGAKVLDVGPGTCPFKRADVYVDFADVEGVEVVKCDLTAERLPFEDKSFDFIYCRHLLEDSWNPFAICAEISRVGKAGYIETPSPFAELGRGVDGNGSAEYRGYHHHRFIAWSHEGELRFVSKYPIVEHIHGWDDFILERLRFGPNYWNTYHLWEGELKTRHYQSPTDFDIGSEYIPLLNRAMNESLASSNAFIACVLGEQLSECA